MVGFAISNMKFKKVCTKSGTINDSAAAEYRKGKLQSLLQQFTPENIFNCDETGLFCKLLPEKTLAFAGDHCHSGEHSNEHRSCRQQQGSRNIQDVSRGAVTLPVRYEKAWVTRQLFEGYVRKLDRKFEQQNRKVLQFVDNCGAAGPIKDVKAMQIAFLPPNTTATLQPMNQGVITNLKHLYKSDVLSCIGLCAHSGKN